MIELIAPEAVGGPRVAIDLHLHDCLRRAELAYACSGFLHIFLGFLLYSLRCSSSTGLYCFTAAMVLGGGAREE